MKEVFARALEILEPFALDTDEFSFDNSVYRTAHDDKPIKPRSRLDVASLPGALTEEIWLGRDCFIRSGDSLKAWEGIEKLPNWTEAKNTSPDADVPSLNIHCEQEH